MKNRQFSRQSSKVTVIDHEPSSHHAVRRSSQPPYSHRHDSQVEASRPEDRKRRPDAVTADFFARMRHQEPDNLPVEPPAWPSFGRPLIAAAIAFTAAVTVPTGFIAMTESLSFPAIDPFTTASTGSSPSLTGLEVSDVSMTRMIKSGESIVTVFGEVTNNTGRDVVPGEIVIQLVDDGGDVVQSWHHRTGSAGLKAGRKLRFMTSAIDVSGNARTVLATARTPGTVNR